ncbi:MAG: hypothetical protein BWY85_02100 [Firmicutes bacterium ADurb.Bin506]|nr:MAG: hypothetical protein BWY85_02100 [Firmicutes bacterium ADurb.Bin506]
MVISLDCRSTATARAPSALISAAIRATFWAVAARFSKVTSTASVRPSGVVSVMSGTPLPVILRIAAME